MDTLLHKWVTLSEAARILRVSEATIRRRVERQEIPCTRIGHRGERIFRREDLDAIVARQEGQ